MPAKWNPPVELSELEEKLLRVSKRTLYSFFRRYRHLLLDDGLQTKLIGMYNPVERGKEALPPAQLALAMLMQAAFRVPDHEVPALTWVDKRWQMVLNCFDAQEPVISQGSIFNFRMKLIEHGLDRVLLEQTVRLARETKGCSAAHLKAALDSSPLFGAGRVEDTFNLIGRAAAQLVRSAAERLMLSEEEVAEKAGIPLVACSSVKAGLDLDWSEPQARKQGLTVLLSQVESLKAWLEQELAEAVKRPPMKELLETLDRLVDQDTEPDPAGGGRRILDGVARDRQISVGDPEMRHGRKSRTRRVDGYKRHCLVDLELEGLVVATAVTPANQPESKAVEPLLERTQAQALHVGELHIDRAYPDAEVLREKQAAGMEVIVKPFPTVNGALFTKEDFHLDFAANTVTCPYYVSIPLVLGKTLEFPAERCDSCPVRELCTEARAGQGRTLKIHLREPFQEQMRQLRRTKEGRARFRQRVRVEHSLARLKALQTNRARYKGLRKNEFDLNRHAAVQNCYVLDGLWKNAA